MLGIFIIALHVIDFSAVMAPDLSGPFSVDDVMGAVPTQGLFGLLVLTFGPNAHRTVRPLDQNGVQKFLLGEVIVELFALLIALLGVKLVFEHAV